ncbi:four helix bundle protein [Microbacter margulisiae]|uniref:Four helix bundle protein n=1 Tax=Microbacter margulisiae TaxID=1350067 RepID=A0A7W5DN69_9PORP|nr:four helix bundle protein [Microbacter margulisiae]MBB3186027.1 four helix bundle protein [Microbacter margulisiae]
MMTNLAFKEQMNNRLKRFALEIIKLYQSLPSTGEATVIGKQVLRPGTSIAANYRVACQSRSGKEFYSKLSIVVEEADETLFWLELLAEAGIVSMERLAMIMQESVEIVKIMATARKNFTRSTGK